MLHRKRLPVIIRRGRGPGPVVEPPPPPIPVHPLPGPTPGGGGGWSSLSPVYTNYSAGDIIFGFVYARENTTFTAPAGWTQIGSNQSAFTATTALYWRRALTNGADDLGTFTSSIGTGGVFIYTVQRAALDTSPIAQFAFASTATGASSNAPALASLSGNSVVLTFGLTDGAGEGVGLGVRTDSSRVRSRNNSGGYHYSLDISTDNPPASWPAQSVPALGGLATGGAHSWAVEVIGRMSNEVDPEPLDPAGLPTFLTSPSITFSGTPATEGDTVTITWATAENFSELVNRFDVRIPVTGVETSETPWAVAPDLTADREVRAVTAIRRTGLPWEERASPWYLVRAIAEPFTLITPAVTMGTSVYLPTGGQEVTFKPTLSFPGLAGETVIGLQWTTADAPTEGDWNPLVEVPGSPGNYRPEVASGPDTSLFTAAESIRLSNFRVRWRGSLLTGWSFPSSFLSIPSPAPLSILSPPADDVAATIGLALIDYNVTTNWTPTDGSGRGERRRAYFTVVALAAYKGDTASYSGRTPINRTIAQCQRWAAGRMPGRGAGYSAQFAMDFVATMVIVRHTPAVWNALTATERTRLSLAVESCMVEGCVETGNDSYWFGLPGYARRTFRGFMVSANAPNYSLPPRLMPYLGVAFFGLEQARTLLDNFTVAGFLARMDAAGGAAGMGDVYDMYFRIPWTLAKLAVRHPGVVDAGSLHKGDGPSAAQIEASLSGTWTSRAQGFGLHQGAEMLAFEVSKFFEKTIQPGLGPNPTGEAWGIFEAGSAPRRNAWVGRLINMGAAASMPHLGQTGMPFEFNCNDEGGSRSSLIYVSHGFQALSCATAAFAVAGVLRKDLPIFAGSDGPMARMSRGVDVLRFILVEGWEDYSKGGRPVNPNDPNTAISMAPLGWGFNNYSLIDHCVEGWFFA